MTINTLDLLVAGCAAGQRFAAIKQSVAAQAAGNFVSLWKSVGAPATGNTPTTTTGETPTSATAGAPAFTNPGSGNSYLGCLSYVSTGSGHLYLYDRLWCNSGLVGNVATLQTVNSIALTRNTGGVGNELWLDVYTALGVTSCTVTAVYTNQAGTGSRTTSAVTIPATAVAQFSIQLPLQSGDTGIQSVQSVTLSISTGTAGNFGLTIRRRLCSIANTAANIGQDYDAFKAGMPAIDNSSALEWLVLANAATTGFVDTTFTIVQG